ncbi:MAG: hypothetical protein ACOYKQ_08155 [Polymorphobacter sp.]
MAQLDGCLRFYRAPFVGLLAFLAVLLANPVMHSIRVAARQLLAPAYDGLFNLALGVLGLAILLIGLRRGEDEVRGTLTGFAAGLLIWIGWASYLFSYNDVALGRPMMAITPEQSRPLGVLFIQGSFGICVSTLLFFILNRDTKCNAFRWLHRKLHIKLGRAESGQQRNFCRITFIETIYVTWFCYGFSLFLGDQRFLGYHHPATYAIGIFLAVWSLYLVWKLTRFTRVMAALRYAIPTKALFWIAFGELGPRYHLYHEFWLHPLSNIKPMLVVLASFLVLIGVTAFMPQRKQKPARAPSADT